MFALEEPNVGSLSKVCLRGLDFLQAHERLKIKTDHKMCRVFYFANMTAWSPRGMNQSEAITICLGGLFLLVHIADYDQRGPLEARSHLPITWPRFSRSLIVEETKNDFCGI